MIRINLVRGIGTTVSSGSDSTGSRSESSLAAMKLFAMLLFPAVLMVYEFNELDNRKAALQQKNDELAAVQAQQAKFPPDVQEKVEEFDREKKRLEAAFQKIAAVAQVRLREVKTLVTIQRIMPRGVWLNGLNIIGDSVDVSGFASNDDAMYEFIGALEKSALFSNIEPRGTSQTDTALGASKKFELAFRVGAAK